MVEVYESGKEVARCNICGEVLDEFDIQNDFSIDRKIGYGSEFDGDDLSISLCCDCMDRIIKSCKVSPVQSLYRLTK